MKCYFLEYRWCKWYSSNETNYFYIGNKGSSVFCCSTGRKVARKRHVAETAKVHFCIVIDISMATVV